MIWLLWILGLVCHVFGWIGIEYAIMSSSFMAAKCVCLIFGLLFFGLSFAFWRSARDKGV